jgi:hypothetical protein
MAITKNKQRAHTRQRRNKRVAVAILAISTVVLLGGFIIGPSILDNYDNSHPLEKSCKVSSAIPETSSTVSRTGIGRSTDQIVIESSDCGKLLLRKGITEKNRDEIASQFTEGDVHTFSIGEGSWTLRPIFKGPPRVARGQSLRSLVSYQNLGSDIFLG